MNTKDNEDKISVRTMSPNLSNQPTNILVNTKDKEDKLYLSQPYLRTCLLFLGTYIYLKAKKRRNFSKLKKTETQKCFSGSRSLLAEIDS